MHRNTTGSSETGRARPNAKHVQVPVGPDGRPCRVCTDFRSLTTKTFGFDFDASDDAYSPTDRHRTRRSAAATPQRSADRDDCPVDAYELGQKTWSFLHSMAAYYPDKPTKQQQSRMNSFFHLFSEFYPCGYCAQELREDLKEYPPETQTQHSLTQWLCQVHNRVNVRLGKPTFDCARVNERWRDGWRDGSCGFYTGD